MQSMHGAMSKREREAQIAGVGEGLEPWVGHIGSSDPNFHPGIKRGKTQIKSFYILFMAIYTLYLQFLLLEVTNFSNKD